MYTAADGVQVPQGPDAFSPPSQFKNTADESAVFHIHRIYATQTAMNNETLMVEGWHAYVTVDNTEWVYNGSWVRVTGQPASIAFTLTSPFTDTGGTQVWFDGISVHVELDLTTTANAGTVVLLTLPAGSRPKGFSGFSVKGDGGALAEITYPADVRSDGRVILYGSSNAHRHFTGSAHFKQFA